jgi:signal transduction histidine kinase
MVARSVAAAGGSILVDDAPGGGARFTVRLPLTKGGAA